MVLFDYSGLTPVACAWPTLTMSRGPQPDLAIAAHRSCKCLYVCVCEWSSFTTHRHLQDQQSRGPGSRLKVVRALFSGQAGQTKSLLEATRECFACAPLFTHLLANTSPIDFHLQFPWQVLIFCRYYPKQKEYKIEDLILESNMEASDCV